MCTLTLFIHIKFTMKSPHLETVKDPLAVIQPPVNGSKEVASQGLRKTR